MQTRLDAARVGATASQLSPAPPKPAMSTTVDGPEPAQARWSRAPRGPTGMNRSTSPVGRAGAVGAGASASATAGAGRLGSGSTARAAPGEQAAAIYEADYRDFNRDTYARGRRTFDETYAGFKRLLLGAWRRDELAARAAAERETA